MMTGVRVATIWIRKCGGWKEMGVKMRGRRRRRMTRGGKREGEEEGEEVDETGSGRDVEGEGRCEYGEDAD